MQAIPSLIVAVGAACGGAAIALAIVALTCFPSGSDVAPRLNLIALLLVLVGIGTSLLAKQVRRMQR
jgi:hypothetical protein